MFADLLAWVTKMNLVRPSVRNLRTGVITRAASLAARRAFRSTIEMLEQRQLLAAVTSASFQYQTTPHRIVEVFDTDVSSELSLGDYVQSNLTTASDIARSTQSLSYNTGNNNATITFPGQSNSGLSGMLPDGNYDFILSEAGVPGLSGEHKLSFFHLIADLNDDRAVGFNDFSVLNANNGDPGTFTWADGDLDGDTDVDNDDYDILSANYGRQLPAPLSAANSLSANAVSSTSINITFSPPSSGTPDGFRVYRSIDDINFGDPIHTIAFNSEVSGYSWTDTGLTHGSKYSYRVRPYTTANGNGETTNKESAVTVLPAPTSLGSTANVDGSVSLSWTNPANNATHYEIERRVGSGSWSEVGVTGNGDTTFIDSSTEEDQDYEYRVRAVSEDTNSAWSTASSVTTTALATATSLSVVGNIDTVDLFWTDRSGVETGYRVQRATNSSFTGATTLADLPAGIESYVDTGLSESTDYYYRIATIQSSTLSSYSSFGLVNTGLAAPSELSTTINQDGSVTLGWTDNSTANTGYKVERSTSADFSENLTEVATLGANVTTYTDTSAAEETTYYYRTSAYNSGTSSTSESEDVNVEIPTLASRTAIINVIGNTGGTGSQSGSVKIYSGQSLHVSLRASGQSLDNNFLKTTALQDEVVRANVKWDFGDSGSRYNKLPGYNAAHIYSHTQSTTQTYTITVTVTVPNRNSAGTAFVSGTDSPSVPSFVTFTGTKVVEVAPVTSTKTIYVDNSTQSGDDGTSVAKALGWNDAVDEFAEQSSSAGKHIRVIFVSSSTAIAQSKNSNNTPKTFNVSGASGAPNSFVTFESSGTTPATITLATDATDGRTASAFQFGQSSSQITIRNIKFQGKTGAGANGTIVAPQGTNIVVDNIKYVNVRNVVNGGEGSNVTGVMILDCNKNAAYHTAGDFRSGEYFLYAGPKAKNIVAIGNTATDDLRINANHNVRMYADEVLLYQNTFRNRGRTAVGTNDGDPNVNTMRANNGYYIWWSENTTYAGQIGLFKSEGDAAGTGTFKNYEVKYVTIERNRLLRDRHLSTPSISGYTATEQGSIRISIGKAFEGSRGTTTNIQDPQREVFNRVGFVAIRNNYVESFASVTNPLVEAKSHNTLVTQNTFKVLNADGDGVSLKKAPGITSHKNVFRGNLIALDGTSDQNHAVLRFPDHTIDNINSNYFASTSLTGVGDNVYPNSGTVTFKFGSTTVTTKNYSDWRGKFSSEPSSRYDVTLVDDADYLPEVGEFRPNSSTIDLARHAEYYGMIDDLFGDPTSTSAQRNRPSNFATNWTIGAVES